MVTPAPTTTLHMSSLTADLPLIPISDPQPRRLQSEQVPRGEFPRSVNWNNPRVAAILDAAAQCFSSRGFTATTLADIGKELGLRKSIVHYYFKSKSTLVEEVQSFAYSRYIEMIEKALWGVFTRPSEAPMSEPPASAARSVTRREPLALGLKRLWEELKGQHAMRGLNLELWSEGRRNDELSMRARTLEAEAHTLIKRFIVENKPTPVQTEVEADDLATLVLALIDGLNVRDEREGPNLKTSRAFETFLALLDR
jgi:AcrR family transcriptional regulator